MILYKTLDSDNTRYNKTVRLLPKKSQIKLNEVLKAPMIRIIRQILWMTCPFLLTIERNLPITTASEEKGRHGTLDAL